MRRASRCRRSTTVRGSGTRGALVGVDALGIDRVILPFAHELELTGLSPRDPADMEQLDMALRLARMESGR